MKSKLNRRNFLKKTTQAGLACGAVMMCPHLFAMDSSGAALFQDEVIDPKKLNYCGYTCPADCKFLVASIENDPVKKKEVYEAWKIKERYKVDFDADKIFCFGCKNPDKPVGVVLTNCTTRACAIEKGYDCCIECSNLKSCDKDLWTRFPDFHKAVVELQKKYQET